MNGGQSLENPPQMRNKGAVNTVQRLRFMRVKETEFYRKEQQKLQMQQSKEMEWCAVGWEDIEELYEEQTKQKELEEQALSGLQTNYGLSTTSINFHGRRSYGKMNTAIENFMSKVDQRIYNIKLDMHHDGMMNQYSLIVKGKKSKGKNRK